MDWNNNIIVTIISGLVGGGLITALLHYGPDRRQKNANTESTTVQSLRETIREYDERMDKMQQHQDKQDADIDQLRDEVWALKCERGKLVLKLTTVKSRLRELYAGSLNNYNTAGDAGIELPYVIDELAYYLGDE